MKTSPAVNQTPVEHDSSPCRSFRTIHAGDLTAGNDHGQANGYDPNEHRWGTYSASLLIAARWATYERASTAEPSEQGDIQRQGSGLGNPASARREFSGDKSNSFRLHPVQNLLQKASEAPEAPAPAPIDNLFLLCTPHRKYATKLIHNDICTLLSDRLFLTNLKLHYRSMRGQWVSLFSLRQLRSNRFVKFEMYPRTLVDIRRTDDIPPETCKDEYRYRPIPAEVIPRIGENHLMHLIIPRKQKILRSASIRYPRSFESVEECVRNRALGHSFIGQSYGFWASSGF